MGRQRDPLVTDATPEPAGALPILFRDDALVIINKPSGLLVHRSPIDRHETRFAVQLLRDQLGRHVYPVHRLDKSTSGALAFALDKAAATALAEQFADQRVRKTYVAIVRGWPAECGVIDHPLDAVQDAYAPAAPAGPKPCRTAYRTLATVELPQRVDRYPTSRYALVELEPDTGRRHQLRRHLAHVSHPIIGDSLTARAGTTGCSPISSACTDCCSRAWGSSSRTRRPGRSCAYRPIPGRSSTRCDGSCSGPPVPPSASAGLSRVPSSPAR